MKSLSIYKLHRLRSIKRIENALIALILELVLNFPIEQADFILITLLAIELIAKFCASSNFIFV